ncbi:unnamed protein product [Lasius platythorax]|uniref:Uncharacterized protein n=1 Tax=Lasius platythorax TaxID=488582 RepID=A0AAV2P108_9HYME
MGAFLENSLFFFVDDTEPILPIFQSPEYGDPGRIVEVTDVGCDTETTYPVHFLRNAFHRRRGGDESYGSTRRVSERLNERPNKFSRTITTILNNHQDRSGNYIASKGRRISNRDYDDLYIADLDYDSCAENPYDDFDGLPKDDPATEYKDTYYTQFVDPRNLIGHANRSRVSQDTRYNCTREPESSFAPSIRQNRRENTSSRQWFTESDERNFRKVRSNERKKRTKILSRTDENFNCEAEFGNARNMTKCRKRDDFSNATDSVALSKDNFWDSVSLENEASCEELTLTDPTKLKNRCGLQPKTSYNLIDSEWEEESEETRRENLSPEISARNAKYQTSKSDAVKEKPKILQSNTLNANSSRIQSARTSIDGRISNNSARKNSINARPRSAVEGKKIGINSSSERRTETMNATFTRTNVDDRRYHVNKLSNETHQPARTFKRVVDSNSNERIYATNEENNTNPRSRNSRNNKTDRTNVAVSRSAAEKKNEKTFTLRMTGASGVEKEKKKFFSRLPIRTWKRLRTKEPAALRLESDVKDGDDNRKFQAVNIVTANSNGHPEKIKSDEIREEIRAVHATADRSDVKRSNRFGIGSLSADKPEVTSSSIKNIKGLKGLSTTRRTSEQQRKRMNIK